MSAGKAAEKYPFSSDRNEDSIPPEFKIDN
jgi:hypothetical protein